MGKTPSEQSFTHPRTGLCLNDPTGDVIVQSKERYTWRLHRYKLQAASSVFADMLDMCGDQSPVIPLSETTNEIHYFLFFILKHRVEPDSTHETHNHRMSQHLETIIPLLEKYGCDDHLELCEREALAIANISTTHFRQLLPLALRKRWIQVSRLCIRELWNYGSSPSDGHSAAPEYWSSADVDRAGPDGYRAMVLACARARSGKELGAGTGFKKEWEKAAELLELPTSQSK